MNKVDSYEVLMGKLGFPGSKRLRAILEDLMTPEQAKMVEALPGTPAQVAAKTGIPEAKVKKTLDELSFKGVVFPIGDFDKRETYRFARHMAQLHDATQATGARDIVKDRHFYELWQDFVMNEWYYRRAEEIKNWESPHGRIVPAYKAIKDLPGVLPCENYPELLKAQDLIAVTPCSCRYRLAAVGKPCAHYNKEDERWTCIQFGRGAEYAIKRGSGKKLSLGEALDLSDHIEDEGLMHVWTNDTNMTGIITSCQCCRDCCMSYVPLEMTNLPHTLRWAKSRYQAYTELAECTGCQVCIDRCPFDAIEMKRLPGEKKMKAVVDPEKCFGCAVCVTGCKPKALKMKVVRPPEHIPVAVEKSHSSGM